MTVRYQIAPRRRLAITNGALATFHASRQLDARSMEAGGILLGRLLVECEDVVVDSVTAPQSTDSQTRFSFFRSSLVSAVEEVVPGLPIVQFRVGKPTPMLVQEAADILRFRGRFTELMAEIRNQGYRRVHVFPAMPVSLAVEMGRQLLPKADPEMEIWDFHESKRFIRTVTISFEV